MMMMMMMMMVMVMVMMIVIMMMMMMMIQVRNLPMGEYIVCGESVNDEGIVLQSTCFNVIIQHLDNSGEQYLQPL